MNQTHQLEFEPVYWNVILQDGAIVTVRADGYSEEDDAFVFSLLMKGDPAYYVDFARFPKSSVRGVEGGWLEPR